MLEWCCAGCGARVPEVFETCPACGADPANPSVGQLQETCLRCHGPMYRGGTLNLHEGTRLWPLIFGNIGELMVNRETLQTHVCSRCGKVEFYAPPAADDGRP